MIKDLPIIFLLLFTLISCSKNKEVKVPDIAPKKVQVKQESLDDFNLDPSQQTAGCQVAQDQEGGDFNLGGDDSNKKEIVPCAVPGLDKTTKTHKE